MFSQVGWRWFYVLHTSPYLATSRPRAAAVRAALALDAAPQAADLDLLDLLDLAKTPPRHRRDGVGHSLRRSRRILQSTAMFLLVATFATDKIEYWYGLMLGIAEFTGQYWLALTASKPTAEILALARKPTPSVWKEARIWKLFVTLFDSLKGGRNCGKLWNKSVAGKNQLSWPIQRSIACTLSNQIPWISLVG